jgi:hypothetical protein
VSVCLSTSVPACVLFVLFADELARSPMGFTVPHVALHCTAHLDAWKHVVNVRNKLQADDSKGNAVVVVMTTL